MSVDATVPSDASSDDGSMDASASAFPDADASSGDADGGPSTASLTPRTWDLIAGPTYVSAIVATGNGVYRSR